MASGRAAALVLLWLAATALSALVVRGMIRLAVLDVPGGRSAHDAPVPRGGGAGMVVAVLLGVPAATALLPRPSSIWATTLLLAAVGLLAAVSWLDDLRQLDYRSKLGAQLGAAGLATAAVLTALPALPAWLPPWLLWPGAAVGFCWLVFMSNAMNFIDGLNGLAAGSTALCGGFVLALGGSGTLATAVALMLSAGLAGFLPYNYPRARIFLGDIGSQVSGLLAGTLALLLLGRGWAGALAVPMVLAGILWDVLFTLGRRALARERLTQAHRGHLYQVAARAGMPRSQVALMHWGFATWGGMLALTLLPDRPALAAAASLLPQPAWTALVGRRARRAGLGRWSS